MKTVLMIMNPREIPECLKAFKGLAIPKVWFKAFWQVQLEEVMNEWIRAHPYDNYIIASDDLLPTQPALDVVLKGLESHEVFTGWCRFSPGNPKSALIVNNGGPGLVFGAMFRLYHMTGMTIHNRLDYFKLLRFTEASAIAGLPSEFLTSHVPFAFTGMRRELWLKYPYRCEHSGRRPHGSSSDHMLSTRLRRDGVPMWAGRDAYFEHLRSLRNFVVGRVPSRVIEEL